MRFEPSRHWGLIAGALLLALGAAIVSAGGADDETDLDQRRTRLAGLSAAEKDELASKRRRFEQLPPDEQQRLRQLHRNAQRSARPRAVGGHYGPLLTSGSSRSRRKKGPRSPAE